MRLWENRHMVPRSAWLGMATWAVGFAFLASFVFWEVLRHLVHAVVAAL